MKHHFQNLVLIIFLFLFFGGPGCAFFFPPPQPRPLPDPENLYTYALNLYREHRCLEAVETLRFLQDSFPLSPRSESADPIIGLALLEAGRPKKAQNFLRLAIQSHPDLTDIFLLSLARAQLASGDTEAAGKNLQAFITLFPASPYLEQALYQQAQAAEKTKDYRRAEAIARELLERFPQSPSRDGYLFLHARAARSGGDLPAAVNSLREIWLQHPLSPLLPEAEDLLSHLPFVPWPPAPEERARQALLLYLAQELDPAEEIYRQLVAELEEEENPRLLASSLFRLGMTTFKKRRYPEARDLFRKLLQSDNLPPELVEETLLYLGRSLTRNREPKEAEKTYRVLLGKYPAGTVSDEALYLLGRLQEDQGAPDEALKTYQEIQDRFPQSEFAAEINWRIGWSSYLRNNFAEAARYFSRIPETGIDLIADLKPRFWTARALSQSGQAEEGTRILEELSVRFPLTYYGFLAALILKSKNTIVPAQILRPLSAENPGPEASGSPESQPGPDQPPPETAFHLQRASELIELGLYSEASQELRFLSGRLSSFSPDAFLPVGLDLVRIGNLPWLLSLCESYFPGELKGKPGFGNRMIWELAYPRGFRQLSEYFSGPYQLDPNLIRAVIREESRFNPEALSQAGAVGLLQIMPPTGRDIARGLGRPGFTPASLHEPETSIEFGYYYLQKLHAQFDGNLAYAIGAYNAGPHKLRDWIAAKPNLDLFEFIEDIPYPETNGYVKKVLQSYIRYSYLYPTGNQSYPEPVSLSVRK